MTRLTGDTTRIAERTTRIAIIGAGFGGVAAAAELLKQGFRDIVVLEKADRLGGVWRDNTYPGCACDIPAPLYSYSFAPNPGWTGRFPPHREILAYLERCAADLGVAGLVRFGAEVTDAIWDGHRWQLTLAPGSAAGSPAGSATGSPAGSATGSPAGSATGSPLPGRLEADVLIPAVGQLSRPALPALPGAESFRGTALHTARWDPDVPIDGRRVAVIGTGASVIQLVPAIAGRAAHITVFQRTAPWTLPKPDRPYSRFRTAAYRRIPSLMLAARLGTWALTLVTGAAVTGNRLADKMVRGVSHVQRRLQIRDPELRAKVTPDEPMGCKRVLFTNAWLPTLTRPDVDLVTEKIIAVTPDGVRTADGTEHRADVLIYGTGFAATEFLAPIRVTGRDGLRLTDVWREGAHAYLGVTVPGFPNMFLVYGPNTNTGNTSVIYFHEAQARYIAQAVRRVALSGHPVEVRPEPAARFDQEMQSRLATSVWTGCQSWYRTATGRIVTNWPGKAAEYRRRVRRLNPDDFLPTP